MVGLREMYCLVPDETYVLTLSYAFIDEDCISIFSRIRLPRRAVFRPYHAVTANANNHEMRSSHVGVVPLLPVR
jgi:hypothetical protein